MQFVNLLDSNVTPMKIAIKKNTEPKTNKQTNKQTNETKPNQTKPNKTKQNKQTNKQTHQSMVDGHRSTTSNYAHL